MALQAFQPRPSRKRSIPWLLYIVLFLSGAIIVSGIYFFFYSNFFKVKEVVFKGNQLIDNKSLSDGVIKSLIKENKFFGKLGTDNIFFWRQPLVSDVSLQLPLLADLQLTKDFFQKKVFIEIKERQMAGIWCFAADSQCYFFDKDGFLFAAAPETSGFLIIKIYDENGGQPVLGQKVFSSDDNLKEFFDILALLKSADLAVDFATIKPAATREWDMQLAAGPILKLSQDSLVADNFRSLLPQIKVLPLAQIRYLDLTVPNRLYYR